MGLSKVKEKFQITIPEDVRNIFPIKVGDYVNVEIEETYIKVKPMVLEEKFLEKELKCLEELFRKERQKAKIMNQKEFDSYLEKL
ncbi:MAG: AbrB/MazE/SpoVT family DNA-binding domain-containing protein [Candidatus Omnitrophota bacterium]